MTARISRYSTDWWLYIPAALVMSLVVIVGFGPSYFYRPFTAPSEPLTALVHIHGALMSLWIVLFLTQVSLIATRRADIHRRLGRLGILLLGLIVVVSVPMTLIAANLGGHHMPGPPLPALALVSSLLAAFVVLAGLGLHFRHHSDVHKRLMLMATMAAVEAGVIRLPLDLLGGIVAADIAIDVLLAIIIAVDSLKHRRLHPTFAWGMAFLIAIQSFSVWLAGTAVWDRAAQGLMRLLFG